MEAWLKYQEVEYSGLGLPGLSGLFGVPLPSLGTGSGLGSVQTIPSSLVSFISTSFISISFTSISTTGDPSLSAKSSPFFFSFSDSSISASPASMTTGLNASG